MLPTTLPDGTLYRVTYEGPSTTNDWTYYYDLVEKTTGYYHYSLLPIALRELHPPRSRFINEAILGNLFQ